MLSIYGVTIIWPDYTLRLCLPSRPLLSSRPNHAIYGIPWRTEKTAGALRPSLSPITPSPATHLPPFVCVRRYVRLFFFLFSLLDPFLSAANSCGGCWRQRQTALSVLTTNRSSSSSPSSSSVLILSRILR